MSTNLFSRFRELLPQTPLLVGQVISHNEDGTSSVRLPGTQVIRVRGQTVAVELFAFVRNGVIEGEAPDLPTYDIAI